MLFREDNQQDSVIRICLVKRIQLVVRINQTNLTPSSLTTRPTQPFRLENNLFYNDSHRYYNFLI